MPDLSKEQVKQMAQLAGLELDDTRSEAISRRLSAVLAELDELPSDELAKIEPAPIFTASSEEIA